MQDLEDVQLLPDDGAEHQKWQPRGVFPWLDVGLRFLGDSQYIVTASSDNLARLWCVETGEIKREYGGHQKAVVCLAFNDSVLG